MKSVQIVTQLSITTLVLKEIIVGKLFMFNEIKGGYRDYLCLTGSAWSAPDGQKSTCKVVVHGSPLCHCSMYVYAWYNCTIIHVVCR